MKVVIAGGYPINKSQIDGISVYDYNLAKYLSLLNYTVHVITLGEEDNCIITDNITIHVLKKKYNIVSINDILNIKNKIIELQPNIVHAQSTSLPFSTALLLLNNDYCIVTLHGNTKYEVMSKFLREINIINFLRLLAGYINEYLVLYKINNIIVVSPYFFNIVKINKHNVIYIPNGFDLTNIDYINSYYKQELQSDLLFIGELSNIKGTDVLLKAVSLLIPKYPSLRVSIAGKGKNENEFKELAQKLSIEKNVKFVGFITGSEKFSYIKSTRIFVVPSRSDMSPSTILEAMACKKPIIASNIGGIPYLINNNGLLFKTDDEYDLSNKIEYLLNNTEVCDEMGSIGEKNLINAFNWNILSVKIAEYYSSISNE